MTKRKLETGNRERKSENKIRVGSLTHKTIKSIAKEMRACKSDKQKRDGATISECNKASKPITLKISIITIKQIKARKRKFSCNGKKNA